MAAANTKEVKEFFEMGMAEFKDEWIGKDKPDHQKLTPEDKRQIAEGIGNGTLTY